MDEFEKVILTMVSFLTALKVIKLIIRCKMRDSDCCNIDMHKSTHIENVISSDRIDEANNSV